MLGSTWLSVRLLHIWLRYKSLSVLRFNTVKYEFYFLGRGMVVTLKFFFLKRSFIYTGDDIVGGDDKLGKDKIAI